MADRRSFDVAVVGVGGIGSGAVYWAAKRFGAGVLGLERFELGHERGASQDHSRIIRLSYHRPDYVRFAQDAYAAWSELEDDSGEQVVIRTGGIDLYPESAYDWMDDYSGALDEVGIGYEADGVEDPNGVLVSAGLARRWWRLCSRRVHEPPARRSGQVPRTRSIVSAALTLGRRA